MPRLEPKVITGTPAAFLGGAQLWAVQTAIDLLPGVFGGGASRGPTAGQQRRLVDAGFVRQVERAGRIPVVTWLTPTGIQISNEDARIWAHQTRANAPIAGTPGINPSAPNAPPARPPSDLDALLRNRTFVPRGGTVTSAPPSDFDRLIIGRTYTPPDLPQRPPTAPRGGTQGEFAAAAGQSLFELLIRPWLVRRRGIKRRGGLRPRPRPAVQTWPGQVRPPSLPPPTPAQPAPRVPSVPASRPQALPPQPATQRPRQRPESTVAQTYRVPAPSTGSVQLPQPRQIPGSGTAPRPSTSRRSLLDPLVALLGLPSPVLATRTGLANFAPPQFSTPSQTVPRQLSMPDPRPLTQFQTQPLPSGSNCECGPKPTRTRAKKCTNPIVSKRTRGNLQIITRRLECP